MLNPLVGLPKKVVTLSLTLLMLVALAAPAHAGYEEGNIGCYGSYKLYSRSASSVSTTHTHWREGRGTATAYSTLGLTKFWGTDTIYRSWSISASGLDYSYSKFYCQVPG